MRNPDPPRPSGVSTWRRAGLRPPPEIDHCTVSSDPWQDGEVRREGVTMWVHRFMSTQLYLGPRGKRLAEERYEHARHMMDTEGCSCAHKRDGADGSACALHTDRGFGLHAQRGNVYTHIIATTHDALPDDLLASLADEVLARLDSGATGASYPQISRSGTLPRPHMLPGSGRIGTVRGSAAPREHGHDHPAA
jgi:hypothetical protein